VYIKLVVLLRNYVTMMHGQQNIKNGWATIVVVGRLRVNKRVRSSSQSVACSMTPHPELTQWFSAHKNIVMFKTAKINGVLVQKSSSHPISWGVKCSKTVRLVTKSNNLEACKLGNWSSSVIIVIMLWAGQLGSHSWITDRGDQNFKLRTDIAKSC
jgi:hypothetical protein